ncbi:hypothetical protein BD626DRAFT_484695 [Schizophyllum amplum]|uniref:MICOS complex subunit MIC12 n=1 Tax=Schizophyllum amplum TaxID=97359 RepID=A0A550CQR1_9AGAR|nr:hypothetical protein BD626DRAFT_484695 [Auriculariopsis ampla]
MSFLVGSLSGAVVAGGFYYGFSNLINSRTADHRRDLHTLSVRLVDHPSLVPAPPSAASRVTDRSFGDLVQTRWNQELAKLFHGARDLDQRAVAWGKSLLYGEEK